MNDGEGGPLGPTLQTSAVPSPMEERETSPLGRVVRPRYYLDTSAVNALCSHPRSLEIAELLRSRGGVLVSAINVVEVGSTRRPARREGLLNTLGQLSGESRPAAFPQDLLRLGVQSVIGGLRFGTISVRNDQAGLFFAMKEPSTVVDERRLELLRYKEDQENWYRVLHDDARPFVQESLQRLTPEERRQVCNAGRLLRFYER